MSDLNFTVTEDEQKKIVSTIVSVCRDDLPRLYSATSNSITASLLSRRGDQKLPQNFVSDLATLAVYQQALLEYIGVDEETMGMAMLNEYRNYRKWIKELEEKRAAEEQASEEPANLESVKQNFEQASKNIEEAAKSIPVPEVVETVETVDAEIVGPTGSTYEDVGVPTEITGE